MQLNSARSLKQSLQTALLESLPSTANSRAVLGFSAESYAKSSEPPRRLALGISRRAGNDFQLAVRIQHRSLEGSPEVDLIRQQALGEVDIRYIGAVTKRNALVTRQRPLLMGYSIGHFKVTAGTLGAFVRERQGGELRILSNNHVLANEDRGKIGDAILQPGRLDGGIDPDDVVGQLVKFVRLKKRGINYVDAAVASINQGIEAQIGVLEGLGNLQGIGSEFLDDGTSVQKLGRTTGHTRGRITAFEMDEVIIGFETGNMRFDNQIEIEGDGTGPFSQGGDSGSLIIDEDLRAVGLLFAGSDQGGANGQGLTYANPIRSVLDELDVDLAF